MCKIKTGTLNGQFWVNTIGSYCIFLSLSHNNVGSGGLICLIFDPSCNCYPNSSPHPDEKGGG